MNQTAKEKLLRMVEEKLAKGERVLLLEIGPDESTDEPGCENSVDISAETVRIVVEDEVRIK